LQGMPKETRQQRRNFEKLKMMLMPP
jgi:hypothetical protein